VVVEIGVVMVDMALAFTRWYSPILIA